MAVTVQWDRDQEQALPAPLGAERGTIAAAWKIIVGLRISSSRSDPRQRRPAAEA